jgi:hypoxanthine phosphoribosyltransferase
MAEMAAIHRILEKADCLYDMSEIQNALTHLAEQLTKHYAETNPLVLCVMNGSLITMGHLLPQLAFPLEIDYIHASRYGDDTQGGDITWFHQPATSLAGREVILVEDIVDHGHTLAALTSYCHEQKAKSVTCATLVNKMDVEKYCDLPEFIGLTVPNRYVFGFGMDYKGYWRNLPGIYAVSELDEEGV